MWVLGVVVVGGVVGFAVVLFFKLHVVVLAPQSMEHNYLAVYRLERALYYGSGCWKANLRLDSAVPGLIVCREDPYLRFLNLRNGTSLRVTRAWSIQRRWLPSGERVFVDYANGYVFWAKDGKVTDFVKLNRDLESKLLDSRPAPEVASPVAEGGTPTPVVKPPVDAGGHESR